MPPVATKAKSEDTPKVEYVTGWCANGGHEGQTNHENPGTVCRGKYIFRFATIECDCFCHAMFAAVREEDPNALADMDAATAARQAAASVTFSAFDALAALPVIAADDPDAKHKLYQKLIETGHVSTQLANYVREHVYEIPVEDINEARSGERRRRGQLEVNVEVVCRLWLDQKLPWPQLTTDVVGLMIDAEDIPSAGAIYAVFDRWASAGLATIGKNPVRFESFNKHCMSHPIADVKGIIARDKDRHSRGFF